MPAPVPTQPRLAPHVRFAQQAWPAPPQATQVPPEQTALAPLHTVPQQGWPRPPHPEQAPFEHVPAVDEQVAPAATHTPA
jgi:hypothetical protein